MRLVGATLLAEFAERHPDAKPDLEAWRLEVQTANWSNPHELKARYPKATLIGGRDVVFNIRHNRYRAPHHRGLSVRLGHRAPRRHARRIRPLGVLIWHTANTNNHPPASE